MKEKCLIYPYSFEFAPLVRHKELFLEYEIVRVVAPMSFSFESKDAAYGDKGCTTGIIINNNYSDSLKECETVIIADYHADNRFKGVINHNILKAVNEKKNIVCTIELEDSFAEEISTICRENSTYFKYYKKNTTETNINNRFAGINEVIDEIDVPVIFISGLAERTNKFEIQLCLREEFSKAGYKVSQIGTRHYCELFGFHSFPDFMYNSSIPESKKVVMFNRFIMNIRKVENPDLVIVGIPGGIMPFNKQFTNRFGILAYEISQALKPDFSLLSVLYDDYNGNYFNMLATSIKYKLGFSVDCFNISNVQFEWDMSMIGGKLHYNIFDYDYIDKKIIDICESKYPVFNILSKICSHKLFSYAVGILENYGEAEKVNNDIFIL